MLKSAFRIRLIWMVHLLVLVCVAALLFHSAGETYWGAQRSDLTEYFYPRAVFVHRWLSEGVIPFWDPHVFSGYPTLEPQQTIPLNPIHLATAWLLPPQLSLAGSVFFNFVCCWLTGCWGFRKWLNVGRWAALAGMATYAFGGVFCSRVIAGHFTVISAMAWWPLAVVSWIGLVRAHQKLPVKLAWPAGTGRLIYSGLTTSAGVCCIVSTAMVILSGAPQYVVYLFWIQAVTALVFWRNWLLSLVSGTVVWVLALLLSAPQWLPSLWYLPFTVRSRGGEMHSSPWSSLTTAALEFLLPFPLGDDMSQPHLHTHNVWELCSYPGAIAMIFTLLSIVLVLVLALSSVMKRTVSIKPGVGWNTTVAAVIALLGIYLMKGSWLPGFGSFREPLKARAIVALAAALATASGLNRLHAKFRWNVNIRRRKVMIARLPEIGMGVTYGLMVTAIMLVFHSPGRFDRYLDTLIYADNEKLAFKNLSLALIWRNLIENAVHALFVSAIFVTAVLVMKHFRYFRPWIFSLFVLADVSSAHWLSYYSHNPFKHLEFPSGLAAAFQPELQRVEQGLSLPFRITLPATLANQSHLIPGLYDTIGYDPLQPHSTQAKLVLDRSPVDLKNSPIVRRLVDESIGRRWDCKHWLDSSNVRMPCECYVSTASIVSVRRSILCGPPHNADTFGPDLHNRYNISSSAPNFHEQIGKPIPSSAASLLSSIEAQNGQDGLLPGETLTMDSRQRPDEMAMRFRLDAPALVAYHTMWLPGWKVRIDGAAWESPLCANNWMLCAPLTAGTHQVTFRYRPVAWNASLFLSLAACLVMAGGLMFRKKRFRIRDQASVSVP